MSVDGVHESVADVPVTDDATGVPNRLGKLIAWIADRNPELQIYILRWDLGTLKELGQAIPESRTVKAGDGVDAIEDSFTIDDYTRWRLLEGLDDIGITLGHDADIAAYEATRPTWKPVTQHA